MTTQTKTYYPQTITQTTETNTTNWNNLDQLKNNTNTTATTNLIGTQNETQNTPALITCTNFQINLPLAAEIQNIQVEYQQQLLPETTETPYLGRPYLTTTNNKYTHPGTTPTTNNTLCTTTFNDTFTIEEINNTNFGFQLRYKQNTTTNRGYLQLQFIRIVITYTLPEYSISTSITTKETGLYKGYRAYLDITVSNLSMSNYNLRISIPTIPGVLNEGRLNNDGIYAGEAWWPMFSSTKSQATLRLQLLFQETGEYNLHLSSEYAEKDVSFTVTNPPSGYMTTNDDNTLQYSNNIPIWPKNVNHPLTISADFFGPDFDTNNDYAKITAYPFDRIVISGMGEWSGGTGTYPVGFFNTHESTEIILKPLYEGVLYYSLTIGDETNGDRSTTHIPIICHPEDGVTTKPNAIIKELTSEELDRLGDGLNYTLQSSLTIRIDDTTEEVLYDLNRNMRIGVFNNQVPDGLVDMSSVSFNDGEPVITVPELEEKVCYLWYYTASEPELRNAQLVLSADVTPDAPETMKDTVHFILYNETDTEYYLWQVYLDWDTETYQVQTETNNVPETVIGYTNTTPTSANTHYTNLYDENDYSNLTETTILENAKYWSNFPEITYTRNPNCPLYIDTNGWDVDIEESQNLETTFKYNKDYPVYIIMTGQNSDHTPEDFTVNFTEPVLTETTDYLRNGLVRQNNHPYPIENTITTTGTSAVNIPELGHTNEWVISDFPFPDTFKTGDQYAIRGIRILWDGTLNQQVIATAQIRTPTGETGERSLLLEPDTTYSIGDTMDTWNIPLGKLTNLQDLEIRLGLLNNYTNGTINGTLNNIRVEVYFLDITDLLGITPCHINDEPIAWYGAYLTSLEDVKSLKTDVDYISISGTDTNDAYLQTITPKEIKLGVEIDGCTIEETTRLVDQFSKIITNDRDKYNRPIPNKLSFPTLYPDEHWDFITEDGFENSVELKDYLGDVKLTIPAGTSYANTDTVTGADGYNNSICQVQPIITILPNDTNPIITETVHNQTFAINYQFQTGDLVEINTITRKATLYRDTQEYDITVAVDMNSDWFTLHCGAYHFETIDCLLQSVTYRERG